MPANEVTLRLLRYFAVLGTELNYRRSAEILFISPPALSSAIKQLEEHVGVQLFVRNTRAVALTPLGADWLPHVRDALGSVDDALQVITRSRASTDPIRIGYLIGTGADVLFRLLRHFEQAYPDVEVQTTEFDFADPTAGLGSGATDVALLRPPVELPRHRMLILDTETWVACLPRDHRFADRTELAIEELLDEPIVGAPESAGLWRDYWLATDVRGGRAANVVGIAETYEAESTMIARGLGISFTTSAIARLYNRPGIRFVPITNRPPSYTALAWNPATVPPAAAALVRHVEEQWEFAEVRDL